jgi:DNA-binding PadR family transcriptional regulator
MQGADMMKEGYITIPMAVLESWVGHDSRYLKWWTWLRSEACWTAKTVWFNRQQVYLQPRQVLVSVNLLVKQWQVSKPTVIRFLQHLEQEKLIERQMDSRKTIITITELGWAESEVKPVVNSAVNIDHEIDRQPYRQVKSSPIIDKNINYIAGGRIARTREEAEAANKCLMDDGRCLMADVRGKMSDEKMAFDEVVAFFNEQMKGKAIPQVAIITQQRRQAFDTLIETTGIDIMSVKQAIVNAAASDFLNGKGQKGWVASFDWMLVPQNFQKVLENFYRNNLQQTPQVQQYGTNGYNDPRRGVEASRTDSYAAGYDRPL